MYESSQSCFTLETNCWSAVLWASMNVFLHQILFLTSNYFHCIMLSCRPMRVMRYLLTLQKHWMLLTRSLNSSSCCTVCYSVRQKCGIAFSTEFFLKMMKRKFSMHWLFVTWLLINKWQLLVTELLLKHVIRSIKSFIYVWTKKNIMKMIEILQLCSEHNNIIKSRVSVLNEF